MEALIVGGGISGVTLARRLAEFGHKVSVIDKKEHIAGNCYDYIDENGICIHKYGAHIFHTDIKESWDFVSRFTKWVPYQHKVKALVDGQFVPVPFNLNSIQLLFPNYLASRLTDKLLVTFGFNTKIPILQLRETGDSDLIFLADYVYKKIFLEYSIKQWERSPEELNPEVTARVPIYVSRDDRYFQNHYQGIPLGGYTEMVRRILDHKNIRVSLSTEFQNEMLNDYDHVYYSGPIDEFFNYCFGELQYRSLHFDSITFNYSLFQDTAVVNYPCNYDFTRVIEYKHFLGTKSNKTKVFFEYPKLFVNGKNERYYPIPTLSNNLLYEKYLSKARTISQKVTFFGRLGDYKYYDMDKAIYRALTLPLL